MRSLTLSSVSVLVVVSSLSAGDMVEPRSVRPVVADGKHNAFTALVRWQGQLWLSFRKAQSHSSGDGDLIVLRSKDGNKWEQALELDVLPDDRDPQLLATPDRLFLYDPALKGGKLTSFVTYTDDGKNWSDPQPVFRDRYIFWKPVRQGDRFYATAHLKSRDGKQRDVYLITSTDGIHWDEVSKIRGGNWESETTIHFESDDKIVAFLRQKYGSPQSSILTSAAPFTQWTARPGPVHFSGHAVSTFRGVDYLFSRTRGGGKTGTMIYIYDGGELTPYCQLPSGGDCSYPAAVLDGNDMLVSYYSSHEGSTNIYLSRVPLKATKAAGPERLFAATALTEEGQFTKGIEGPACDAEGNVYAVNFQKQQTIGRVTPDGQGDVFVVLPGKSVGNGIRFDVQGRMYVADYVGHNILRVNPETRKVEVFAHHDEMNQPNDLAIGPDGTLYASDPNWGKSTGQIWRIDRDGSVSRLASGLGTTNGIEVSPDGKTLYVNESAQRKVWAFTITGQHELADKRLLKEFPDHGFDGMRCDVDGNLYVTRYGKGTVVKLSPDGEVLEEIGVLGPGPSNICFGGPDGRTAYVTEVEHTRLVQFRVDRPGLAWKRWQDR